MNRWEAECANCGLSWQRIAVTAPPEPHECPECRARSVKWPLLWVLVVDHARVAQAVSIARH